MRISKILNGNEHKGIAFTAGKTKILSDFDGTFMPSEFNHDVICNNRPPVNREAFKAYFDSFEHFLNTQNKDKQNTELTVSTGRNLYEFDYYMAKIRERGLRIPNPDKLIITNGGDEFLHRGGNYFENGAKNMFSEEDVNLEKRMALKRFAASYRPMYVRQCIKEFLWRLDGSPVIIEPETHQGLYGYNGGMTLQENIEKLYNRLNYISVRKDGAYQIRMTVPKGSVYIDRLKEIPPMLADKGMRIASSVNENDPETFVNCVDDPNRWEHGTSVEIKPATDGKVKILDKFHHVKLESDKIIREKSNDLVIVSGDGKNDLDMLDLSNYIDSMKDMNDFSKPEFRREVSELPIISIFVRNSDRLDSRIYDFERNFNFDGIRRFIVVDKQNPFRPHTLLDAIKMAQEEYSKINSEYKRNLPSCE